MDGGEVEKKSKEISANFLFKMVQNRGGGVDDFHDYLFIICQGFAYTQHINRHSPQ